MYRLLSKLNVMEHIYRLGKGHWKPDHSNILVIIINQSEIETKVKVLLVISPIFSPRAFEGVCQP